MTTVTFTRPDGQPGSYGDWRAEVQARWAALTPAERDESRKAAYARHQERQVANDAGDAPAVLNLYDEIGFFGISAADLVNDIQGIKGGIELHLNSPGGDVFGGVSIYNALKNREGTTRVIVDGLAASCASFIAMAADPGELVISENATMMIHDAWGGCVGDAAEMSKMAQLLDSQSQNIASIYAARSGQPADMWRSLMRGETWVVGQEAVDVGLADRLLGSEPPAPASPVTIGAWQVTVHAAPVKRKRKRTRNAVDNSSWDGGAAMSAAASSDDPSAAYSAICAGKRDGDPDKQSTWALPHHKHPGDPPNAAGVRNALARLPQTDGLTNHDAAQAHLQAHMKAISPDSDNHAGPDLSGWDAGQFAAALKGAFE
jgi:ATP-dependent Clp endopeptidase proteolytic subunit ClpP